MNDGPRLPLPSPREENLRFKAILEGILTPEDQVQLPLTFDPFEAERTAAGAHQAPAGLRKELRASADTRREAGAPSLRPDGCPARQSA